MTSTLLIVQFVLAILLTIIILLQKSSSIGLGAYSGSNDSLFGAKGPANFLTKATMALGLVFVINTVALGYLYNQQRNQSAVDTIKTDSLIPTTPTTQTDSAPAAPTATPVPTAPENK
ncbi:MAG: preprotein translocase subunit SecG [Arcobacter sp.]|jgi:preprotein translocase subunit SecG|uniref:Protein-export membrane protein SecG n=1 Tax=Arcobacter defluvii TaxID=873191 RepID=A0AAE7BHU3_9BACT|nr:MULTISPECIES: preprotein translocase subunit SecG [Arcobacter]MDY3201198.1 preprotein translocase subunit SecG [Arcobacter sp.]QKF78873.1 preprotein translocase SecYEG, SecG subunit [Arcobacter defluvii]RXI30706.1 preprotein translocase subunit SecG [Arcobacter defluvii]BAK74630.1 protein-export membrane protein SecG [Arcobacter sp. L]